MYAITFNDNVLFVTNEEFGNKFLKEFEEYQKNIHYLKHVICAAESKLYSDYRLRSLKNEQFAIESFIQNAISNKEFDKLPKLTDDLDNAKKRIKEYRSEILDPSNNDLEEYLKTVPNIHKKFINYVDCINCGHDTDFIVYLEKLNEYNDFETMMERY